MLTVGAAGATAAARSRRPVATETDGAARRPRSPIVFMGLLGLDSHNREEERLVRRLVERGHPLLYLAPLGTRGTGLGDILAGLRRLRRSRRAARTAPGLRSATLLVLPWRGLPAVAWLNRFLVRCRLARALRSAAGERAVLWLRLPTPELVEQLERLRPRAVVYECIDDYSAYPQYGEPERRRLARFERQLVDRADLVVTLTSTVAARFPEAKERIRIVPLGVDLERFGPPPGPLPADLALLPGPRLGLVGHLDGRVDFELLRRLALAEPSWSLVLIGPAATGLDVAALAGLPNVHLLGPRAYELVPNYLAGLDVCLIPYRNNAWTAGCFPTKLHEYLASGRPIVATDLPGLAAYDRVVDLAPDVTAFITACRRAVAERDPAPAAQRRALAATQSLEARCRIIDELLRALPV